MRKRFRSVVSAAVVAAAVCRPALAQAIELSLSTGVCEAAAVDAERAAGLPAGLLVAIGHVESGRRDGAAVRSWPWAVNADGVGMFADSPAAAVALVRTLQAQGARSIDLGCFQINMQSHPGAFATLDDAFDPPTNARYAARFLASLQAATGRWEDAVGRYHSANLERALPYRERVLRSWGHAADDAALPVVAAAASGGWATLRSASQREVALRGGPADASAAKVRVWTPGATAMAAVMPAAAWGAKLPAVQVPNTPIKY